MGFGSGVTVRSTVLAAAAEVDGEVRVLRDKGWSCSFPCSSPLGVDAERGADVEGLCVVDRGLDSEERNKGRSCPSPCSSPLGADAECGAYAERDVEGLCAVDRGLDSEERNKGWSCPFPCSPPLGVDTEREVECSGFFFTGGAEERPRLFPFPDCGDGTSVHGFGTGGGLAVTKLPKYIVKNTDKIRTQTCHNHCMDILHELWAKTLQCFRCANCDDVLPGKSQLIHLQRGIHAVPLIMYITLHEHTPRTLG